MFETFTRNLIDKCELDLNFRVKVFVLWVLPLIPIFFKFLFLLIFWLFLTLPAHAQTLEFNDAFPYEYYGINVTPHYCLTTTEVLAPDDSIYICKKISVYPIANSMSNPSLYGRAYCWHNAYGGWWGGWSRSQISGGIVLSEQFDYSSTRPAFDRTKICVKKAEVSPQTCDINIVSIINGAFSNKFPMDLLSGFNSNSVTVACPSFTVNSQTFQLCYLNQLTRVLKYVLLLVFVITSVIAL